MPSCSERFRRAFRTENAAAAATSAAAVGARREALAGRGVVVVACKVRQKRQRQGFDEFQSGALPVMKLGTEKRDDNSLSPQLLKTLLRSSLVQHGHAADLTRLWICLDC